MLSTRAEEHTSSRERRFDCAVDENHSLADRRWIRILDEPFEGWRKNTLTG